MKIASATKIHCVGIGGIGVSALARLFLSRGCQVSGSDIKESPLVEDLRRAGAVISIGHAAGNVPAGTELAVHTEDVNPSSPGFAELAAAKTMGAQVLTYSQALGLMMEGKRGVGISGTNGKSTTTAMLGLIAEKAGLDPTVIVGSKVPPTPGSKFTANFRSGASDLMIVEADEYHRHMLDARPWAIALTNIAPDHLDYYADLAEIKQAFAEYVKKLPPDGFYAYNADDSAAAELAALAPKAISYGFSDSAGLQAAELTPTPSGQEFVLRHQGQNLGKFALKAPGRHNVSNAMCAAAAAMGLGISPETIRTALAEFGGIWRRFEIIGKLDKAILVSDYAHHPDGIAATLQAARDSYPGAKVLAVFQPHQKSRTLKLFHGFVESLQGCQGLIVTEIFSVVGREPQDYPISGSQLVSALDGKVADLSFAENLEIAQDLVRRKAKDYDLIIFMGAGSIDQAARALVE